MTTLALSLTLAWRPFLDPLDLHQWWYLLLIPVALGVSMAYKAVRVHDLKAYPWQVGMMTVQVVLGMIALAVVAHLIVEVFARQVG